jgi:tetratricopeptide (TPR) repeat protein
MTTTLNIFISSKMLELKAEREALDRLLPTLDYGEIKLNAWVFEVDQPPADSPIRKQYLKWLKESELYIGLFWKGYGPATIDEFDHAKHWGIERHIYVKHAADSERDPQLRDFLTQISDLNTGITSKWFHTPEELAALVKARLDEWVREYRSGPGGEAAARLYQTPAEILGRDEELIGRVDQMVEARAHLQQNARLLLQGFSGTGKSRLAAELAAEFTPALWLRAGRNDSDTLFEALARPFNLAEAVAKEVDEAKILLVRQVLARSDLKLLVLDDAWNGPALAEVLKAIPPTLLLLVTSRKRLEVGQVIEVGNLPPDEARALLRYHAGDYADKDGADDLCKLLGHLAFALRIAGKLLPKRKYTPSDLRREIEAAPFAMQLDVSEKGRENVARLIEVSLLALDEAARNVFLAFGAFFAPRLTPEMLMRYFGGKPEVSDADLVEIRKQNPHIPTDMPDDELRREFIDFLNQQEVDTSTLQAPLTQLHDQGLVERVPPVENVTVEYYSLHDLAYAYAAAQMTTAARHRALDACLSYLTRYNSPGPGTFAALRPELDGLLEGAKWAFEHDRYEDAALFADSLFINGNQILTMQGSYTQVINLCSWTVQAARQIGDRRGEAAALGNLGNAYNHLGRYDGAIDQFQQILPIFRQIGDRRGEANALGNLGNAYNHLGRYDEAIDHLRQQLTIARQIGYRQGEANALGNLGLAYFRLGRYDQAIDQQQQSLAIKRQIRDQRGEANSLGNLGNAYFRLGRYDEAIDHLRQHLTIARQIGDRGGEANALGSLGIAYSRLGRYDEAIDHHQQYLTFARQIGDRGGEAQALGNLGNAYNKLGRYDEAIDHLRQQLTIARQIGDRLGEGNALNNLGRVLEAQAQFAEAVQHYEAARVIYAQLGVPELATAERNLARARARLSGGG